MNSVSMPRVLFIQKMGKTLEPIDKLIIDVPIIVRNNLSKMGVRKVN